MRRRGGRPEKDRERERRRAGGREGRREAFSPQECEPEPAHSFPGRGHIYIAARHGCCTCHGAAAVSSSLRPTGWVLSPTATKQEGGGKTERGAFKRKTTTTATSGGRRGGSRLPYAPGHLTAGCRRSLSEKQDNQQETGPGREEGGGGAGDALAFLSGCQGRNHFSDFGAFVWLAGWLSGWPSARPSLRRLLLSEGPEFTAQNETLVHLLLSCALTLWVKYSSGRCHIP